MILLHPHYPHLRHYLHLRHYPHLYHLLDYLQHPFYYSLFLLQTFHFHHHHYHCHYLFDRFSLWLDQLLLPLFHCLLQMIFGPMLIHHLVCGLGLIIIIFILIIIAKHILMLTRHASSFSFF